MVTHFDLFIKNAHIVTLEPENPRAECMAISNGRILALGEEKYLKRLASQAKQVIDFKGRTIVPGFIDSHAHLAGQGLRLMQLDLGNTKSTNEALLLVQERLKKARPRELVLGYNWDESNWTDPRYLTKKDLDPISPNNPVVLKRVCGHLISVNSLALQLFDIDINQPGVDKDTQTGEVTGILREITIDPGQFLPLQELASQFILKACQYANSLGVTSVHENLYCGQLPMIREYLRLKNRGQLTVRVYANLEAKLFDRIASLGLPSGLGDENFRLGGVKTFIDGSLGAQTAALTTAYADKPGSKGMLLYSEEDFTFLLEAVNRLGQQIHTHAIGDEGIDMVLRCHERVSKSDLVKTLRHTIIHAELLTDPLIPRVKKLGMMLLMQPNFVHRWGLPGGMYDSRVGPTRALAMNNFRKILDAGIRIAFGSDCMPMNPIYGIYSATTHPNPRVRISIEEALRSYTIESAYASFEDCEKGSLAPGKLADFLVLSADLLSTAPKDLRKVIVEQTYVGGKLVYSHV